MLFGDAPTNRTIVWYPEPRVRGSFSILSSCIVTLGLCIWTSVHLNIPTHNSKPKRRKYDPRGWISKQQWRKVKWLVLGMLAPEMVRQTTVFPPSAAGILLVLVAPLTTMTDSLHGVGTATRCPTPHQSCGEVRRSRYQTGKKE